MRYSTCGDHTRQRLQACLQFLVELPGAASFVVMEELIWSEFLEFNRAILGLVIVVLIFFLPNGLLRLPYRELAHRLGGTGRREAAE